MRRNGWLGAGLAALLVWAAAAGATAQDDRDTARARTLFQEGIELAEHGRFEEAAAKFREARALRDAPAVRLNLALCLRELNRDIEAANLARSVVDDPTAPTDVRSQAETLAAALAAEGTTEPPEPGTEPAPEPTPIEDGGGDADGDRSLARDWRLWAGVGGGVVLIILIAVIAATAGGGGGVVQGDFEPAVLRW